VPQRLTDEEQFIALAVANGLGKLSKVRRTPETIEGVDEEGRKVVFRRRADTGHLSSVRVHHHDGKFDTRMIIQPRRGGTRPFGK